MHRLLTAVVAAATMVASSLADAQSPPQAPAQAPAQSPAQSPADALFDEARKARVVEDYASCHEKAEQAWQLDPQSKFAALSGDCALAVGKPLEAERRLRHFLDHRPEGTPDAFLQHVEGRLSEARRQLGSIVVTLRPPGATATIDDEAAAPDTPHFVLPGAHTVAATAEGHNPALRKVEVMRGQRLAVELFLSPVEPVAAPDQRPAEPTPTATAMPLWPAFVAGGAGVVAIAVGAGLLGASAGAASDADDQLAAQRAAAGHDSPCNEPARAAACSQIASLRGDEESLHNAGLGVVVVGGVLVAGAAAYAVGSLVLGDDGDHLARVAPWAGTEGGGLTVRGRF